MKILSIETSNTICSVAILEDRKLIKKIELDNGLTHSETLMPIIQQIFSETNLTISNIDLLVSDIGPGSFTGIRIGIATVKAFSDVLSIPAIGISSLEALAYNVNKNGLICSMIDCKNNNCYFSVYSCTDGLYSNIENPQADSIHNCLQFLASKYSDTPIFFVGDAVNIYKNDIQDFSKDFLILENNTIDVFNLGLSGLDHFNNNNFSDVLPLYLKKPQAQKQLELKNVGIQQMHISDLDNFNISDFDSFWNISNLKDELNSSSSYILCAKLDNSIIGFIDIKIIIDEADIMNIAIKNTFRRQGFASTLIKQIISFCSENNIKVIIYEVNEENFAAISLYKKNGFIECGKRKNYYDNKYDAILMKLNL